MHKLILIVMSLLAWVWVQRLGIILLQKMLAMILREACTRQPLVQVLNTGTQDEMDGT